MATTYYYEGKTKVHCCDCDKVLYTYQHERVNNTPRDVLLDEEGYYHYNNGLCEACRIERRKKKIQKITKITAIVVIVVAVCLGVSFLNEVITAPLHKWTYNKVLEKCENNPKILTNIETKNGVGTTTFDTLKKDLADGDYFMHIYGEGHAEIQQYTNTDGVEYYWRFGKGYGELADTTYILKDGLLYALGEKDTVYYSSSKKYTPLLQELNAYLPHNYCGKSQYTSESWLNDSEQLLTAHIVYGDGMTCLYYHKLAEDTDEYNTYYYESGDDVFVRVKLEEYRETATLAGIPDVEDCMQIRQ